MNQRERFVRLMQYQPVDRCPIWDFGFWEETLPAWQEQGMPRDVHPDDFFGMDMQWRGIGVGIGLSPAFESKVLEDQGDRQVILQNDGVIVLQKKTMKTIPHYIDWTLKDRASWGKEFRPRLDPDTPGRIPDDFVQQCKANADATRTWPLSINAGSLFGKLRDYMGFQNIAVLVYDDPGLLEEMIRTTADLIVTVLSRALKIARDNGVTFDYAGMWEDMCFNHGPIIGPKFVAKWMQPHYRRISDLLRSYGCNFVVLDCDGKIDELIPIWLDAGVNVMFPLEIGTWGADPIAYRKRFGNTMRIMGGFDKHILASSKDAITKEVHRLAPLVEEGGFIPFCDHRVPMDVCLENYLHYINMAKKVFGKDLPDLRPTGRPEGGVTICGAGAQKMTQTQEETAGRQHRQKGK
jgi:uroporphyrinogen-III decarboxylase